MSSVKKKQGDKCFFSRCNATKRDNPNRVFFKFPVANPEVCSQWILNCGNESLSELPESLLKRRTVCDRHFERSSFTSDMRTRLEKHAIPTLPGDIDDDDTPASVTSPLTPVTQDTMDTSAVSSLPQISSTGSVPTPLLHTPSVSQSSRNLSSSLQYTAGPSCYSTPCTTSTVHHVEPVQPSTANQPSLQHQQSPNTAKCTRRPSTKRKLIEDTPRKIRLRKSLTKAKTTLHRTTVQLKRLKSKHKPVSKLSMFKAVCREIKSDAFKTLLKMQMMHKKGCNWTDDEKQLAIELFYRSPTLYNNMRDDKNFNLPSRKTICRWLNVMELKPGLCDELLHLLKIKVKNMSLEERQVTLMFDEMSIKKSLQYNEKRDVVEGFQDLGAFGRTPEVGDHVLMFLIRGLFYKWKMPVAYFVTYRTMPGDKIVTILQNCITSLSNIGLTIRSVTCDQGTNNQKAASILNITETTPYFNFQGKKIFFIFDAPHLFKSIRNTLLKTSIQHGDGVWAKWDHFVKLFHIDVASSKARSLCKITEKHIAPNAFDKMKVKLATQVFSHSVTAAMLTAVQTGQLPTDARNTATFLGRLNDTFDCLNSKVQFDANPLKCAVSSTTVGVRVQETLESALAWIKTWRCEKISSRSSVRPPCFSGLCQTISSVLQLWNELKEEDVKFLLTNRLTQDALENEFSIARQRCGYDKNPSAMQFRQNLRHRIQVTLMKPPESSNCEIDDDVIPIASDLEATSDMEEEGDEEAPVDQSTSATADYPDEDLEIDVADDSWDPSDDDEMDIDLDVGQIQPTQITPASHATLESCSVQYVAGYLAKVCLKKFSCEECRQDLTTDTQLCDEKELLILHRSYATKDGTSHLTAPSVEMARVTDVVLSSFHANYDRVKHIVGVKSSLVYSIKQELIKKHPGWLKLESNCREHREFLLNFVVRLKIVKTVLWTSRSLRMARYVKTTTKSIPQQKLKNLQHL